MARETCVRLCIAGVFRMSTYSLSLAAADGYKKENTSVTCAVGAVGEWGSSAAESSRTCTGGSCASLSSFACRSLDTGDGSSRDTYSLVVSIASSPSSLLHLFVTSFTPKTDGSNLTLK